MPRQSDVVLREEPTTYKCINSISDDDLYRARFRLFYEQASVAFIPVLFVIATMVFLTYDSSHYILLSAWCTGTLISYIVRFRIRTVYLKSTAEEKLSKTWYKYNLLAVTITGFIWGIGAVLLFPVSALNQTVVLLIIGFMAAGNTLTHAALPWISQAFVLSILSPMIFSLFMMDSTEFNVAASLLILLMLSLLLIARESQTKIVNAILLRFESEEQFQNIKTENDETRELNTALKNENRERKKSESVLLNREIQYLNAMRIARFGAWEWDISKNDVRWYEETYRIYGVQPGTPVSFELFIDTIYPDDREKVSQAVEGALSGNKDYSIDHRVLWPNGEVKWVHVEGEVHFDSDKRAIYMEGVVQDVNERKVAEEELRCSENELQIILENLPDTYYRTDINGNLIKLSSSVINVVGFSSEEVLGTPMSTFYVDPNGRDKFIAVLQAHDGRVNNYEAALRHKDGHEVWVSTSARYYRDENDNIAGIEGVTRDITDRKTYERDLFEEKERAQVTLEAINDVVISTDVNGIVEYATPVLEEFLGWKLKEIKGRPISRMMNIVNEETGERIPDPVAACLNKAERIEYKHAVSILHKDNKKSYSIELTVAPIKEADDTVIGTVVALHDISVLRGLARELSYQATHDPLTGLINRREFEARIDSAIVSSNRDGIEHALCYVDLDQFKIINDTCGHAAGDEVLRQLSPILQRSIRSSDTIARLGGDEFGIFLQACSLSKAQEVLQGLQNSINEFRFVWNGKVFDIGASMGLVEITDQSGTLSDIMSAADSACYVAKELGRKRIHVYESDETIMTQHMGHMEWYNRINRALEEGRFELYFQPIRDADSGIDKQEHVVGEFLLRMRGDDGKLIAPGFFIPVAERYHLMLGIDSWVVREVLKVIKEIHINSYNGNSIYTINISAQSLAEESFLDFVREQINSTSVPAKKLCFEITETAVISNLNYAIDFIEELKSMGCRFALDDFGSGVSSLANLKKLPVDYVKIDGEFIKGMLNDPADRAMVTSIVNISQVMGLQTIAEFVEDDEHSKLLAAMGVDFVQGYGIGMPESVNDIFH